MRRFEGKVAIVTASSTGIGYATGIYYYLTKIVLI
jgi:NAD(P)-dependent dehydrogenase (short-subunit alcohol dehydrogenase family)